MKQKKKTNGNEKDESSSVGDSKKKRLQTLEQSEQMEITTDWYYSMSM
jgi:hypothetical protein